MILLYIDKNNFDIFYTFFFWKNRAIGIQTILQQLINCHIRNYDQKSSNVYNEDDDILKYTIIKVGIYIETTIIYQVCVIICR